MMSIERIRNRRIGVVGMARSGVAAALLGHRLGADVFVSDAAPAERLREQIYMLETNGVPYETGRHSDKLLECDYLVLSPGVPLTVGILASAREKGLPMFSEIEFASWVCKGSIVAITGSNGKTTTTTLIGEILAAAGLDTVVCGNIGLPFAQMADKVTDDGIAVLEVSSFQLETIEEFQPSVAVILNISADHLERHGGMEGYKHAKYRVAQNQTSEDVLILNHEDESLAIDRIATKATVRWFATDGWEDDGAHVRDDKLFAVYEGNHKAVCSTDEILIQGPHNLQNAAAAAAVAAQFEVKPDVIKSVLKKFAGVEHRLESIGRVAGVDFINDSKATNVDSVCYALRSLSAPLHLILGGRDKGASYAPIAKYGRGKIRTIAAIGEAKEKVFNELGKTFSVQFADSLEAAVQSSFELASPGDVVLLSPGCASFDMFDNFEHRGRAFKEAVESLKKDRTDNETITR